MVLKTLHVTQPVDAGVAVCVLQLVEHQVKQGNCVAVGCPPSLFAEELGARGATVFPWPASRSPGLGTINEVRSLAGIIEEFKPDLLHLHSAKAGLAGRIAARGRVPTVFQPHAWSFEVGGAALRRLSRDWERLAAPWTDVAVCVSDAERSRGREEKVACRMEVVHNGVDAPRHLDASRDRRTRAKRKLGLGDAALAVCVGRLSRQKGQDMLIEAWRSVRRLSGREVQLAVVGDGPNLGSLRTQALGDSSVFFAGRSSDIPNWLDAANVVVAPSRYEGFAMVPLEAMARARSVVLSAIGPHSELLETSGSLAPGALIDLTRPEGAYLFAKALAHRLLDVDYADAEGALGRRLVLERFNADRSAVAMSATYERVLRERDL